jgi:hypothetical protein
MFLIIGDSHCGDAWVDVEKMSKNIKRHWVGPVLCNTIGKDLNKINVKKFNLKKGDYLCFCFGEIDCRCHIYNQCNKQNKHYKIIIDELVHNYFNALNHHKKLLDDVKICVYNIPPPIKKNDCTQHNKEFPFVGSDEDRKKYSLYFNECLKKYCEINNFLFFDIYDIHKDKDGFLRNDLSDRIVHIKNPKYIIEFLNKHIPNWK